MHAPGILLVQLPTLEAKVGEVRAGALVSAPGTTDSSLIDRQVLKFCSILSKFPLN